MPVTLLHTVRGSLPVEVVSLHRTGRSAAFTGADDVDRFDFREDVDLQLLADVVALDRATQFANEPFRFTARFGARLDSCCRATPLPFAVKLGNVAACRAAG